MNWCVQYIHENCDFYSMILISLSASGSLVIREKRKEPTNEMQELKANKKHSREQNAHSHCHYQRQSCNMRRRKYRMGNGKPHAANKKHMISIHIKKIYNKNHNNNGKMRSHTNTHITSHLWKKCSCQTEKACLVYSVYKFHAKIRATRNLIPGKFFLSLVLSLHLSPWKYVNVHQIAWQLQKCRPYFPVSLFHFDCFIIMIWLS